MKCKPSVIAAILASALLLVFAGLPYLIKGDSFRPALESYLGSALGRKVRIGELSISLLAGGLRAENVSIADDPAFSMQPFVRAHSVNVGVSLLSLLLSRSLHVSSLTLKSPEIVVLRSSTGKWNFSSIGGQDLPDAISGSDLSPSAPSFVLNTIRISDASLVIGNEGSVSGRSTYQHVDIEAHHVSFTDAMNFAVCAHTANGGMIQLNGEAGPVNRENAAGTPFHGTLRLQGVSLADAVEMASPSLSGGLDYQGTISSDGNLIQSEGSGRVSHLRLFPGTQAASQPVSFHYATEYSVRRQRGVLHSTVISAGTSQASLSGNFDNRGREPRVHLFLTGDNLALNDIKGVLPAFGLKLPAGSALQDGTVSAKLRLDGPVSRLVTIGNVQLSDTRLFGFDLGSQLGANLPAGGNLSTGSSLLVLSLNSRFRIGPEGTQIQSFATQLSGIGGMNGAGVIDASNHLNCKVNVDIADDGLLARALNRVGAAWMPHQIPLDVRGTTARPIITPDRSILPEIAKYAAERQAKQQAKSMVTSLLHQEAQPGKSPTAGPSLSAPLAKAFAGETQHSGNNSLATTKKKGALRRFVGHFHLPGRHLRDQQKKEESTMAASR